MTERIDKAAEAEREMSRDTLIIWKCTRCGAENELPSGWYEDTECSCGGMYVEVGMSYDSKGGSNDE